MPISPDIYKQLGRSAAGAVSVTTAYDRTDDRIVGLTVSSFVTLSFDPPLVMFALQHDADSYASMVSSQGFGVSILDHRQTAVATRLATKGAEKTGATHFEEGHSLHVPLIPDSLAHIECRTHQIFISGDHALVVGLVEQARMFRGSRCCTTSDATGRSSRSMKLRSSPSRRAPTCAVDAQAFRRDHVMASIRGGRFADGRLRKPLTRDPRRIHLLHGTRNSMQACWNTSRGWKMQMPWNSWRAGLTSQGRLWPVEDGQ